MKKLFITFLFIFAFAASANAQTADQNNALCNKAIDEVIASRAAIKVLTDARAKDDEIISLQKAVIANQDLLVKSKDTEIAALREIIRLNDKKRQRKIKFLWGVVSITF